MISKTETSGDEAAEECRTLSLSRTGKKSWKGAIVANYEPNDFVSIRIAGCNRENASNYVKS